MFIYCPWRVFLGVFFAWDFFPCANVCVRAPLQIYILGGEAEPFTEGTVPLLEWYSGVFVRVFLRFCAVVVMSSIIIFLRSAWIFQRWLRRGEGAAIFRFWSWKSEGTDNVFLGPEGKWDGDGDVGFCSSYTVSLPRWGWKLHLVRKRDDGKCTDRSVALVVGRDAHVSTFSIYACAGKYSH